MIGLRDIANVDVDEWLSYKTAKQVIVRDWYYGLMKLACNLLVLLYIILFSFIIGRGCYIY